MTDSEKTQIVNQVLAAIQTNSRSVMQLTPVNSLGADDWFEISGGKRISYTVLATLIASLSSNNQDDLLTAISQKTLQSASITCTATSATLSIATPETTITCTIPIATDGASGIITAEMKRHLDTAYERSGLAMEKANAAKATADDAKEKADAHDAILPELQETVGSDHTALGKLALSVGDIDIADIDTLSNIDKNHGRYLRVKSGNRTQGWLMNLPCYAGHIQQQIFTTYLPLDENGNITTHHDEDSAVHVYKRLYNIDRGNLTISNGETIAESEWSKWVEVGGEAVWTTIEQAKSEILGMLPALNDVLEFGGIFNDVTIQENPSTRSSTDIRCKVIYDKTSEKFLLAVAKANITDEDWSSLWGNVNTTPPTNPGQHGEITPTTPTIKVPSLGDDGVIDKFGDGVMTSFNFYDTWADMNLYCDSDKKPLRGKVYIDTTNEMTYRYNGSTLVSIGSNLTIGTEEGTAADGGLVADLISKVGDITFINMQKALELTASTTLTAVIQGFATLEITPDAGLVATFIGEHGWESHQFVGGSYINPSNWVSFGGGSAIGNSYNVTAERITRNEPRTIEGGTTIYDNLESALGYAYDKGVATVGMQVTFAIASGSWKNYQFVGTATNNRSQFVDPINWIDLAGQSSGSEPIININHLCKDLDGYALNNDCYTLANAILALKRICQDTGIDYIKKGLIITYKIDNNAWETKQFVGEVSDAETTALWHDFGGGGGTEIETSDEPADGGQDAFSTGGAYEHMPTDIDSILDEDTGNTEYFMINAKGNKVGRNSIVVPAAGSGGGAVSASSLTITLRDNPLYAAFGTDITTKASIRSVTKDGDDITTNVIKQVSIQDATTGVTLWTNRVDKASSASQYDYSFEFDFTPFIASAGSREFVIVATDDEGNTKPKTITVVAVDATVQVKGIQTLHYTSQNVFTMGSNAPKSISLYKFPNATRRAPIEAKIEMFFNGEWRTLEETTIEDNYTKSISINPSNVFGGNEAMTHGAYPIRIQGTDVNSGVSGNIVYTGVMCVGRDYTAPIVLLRYDDVNKGSIKLYDTANIEVAAYTPGATSTAVKVYMNGEQLSSLTCFLSQTHSVSKQIQGFTADGTQSVSFYAQAQLGAVITQTNTISLVVFGSAIDAIIKDGAAFGFDFASRSNEETDHTISNNNVTMNVVGSNWSSNGFVRYLGETALAIKENVTASIPYQPFGSNAAKSNGAAVQFAFATNNIKDSDAMLMECYDANQGVGFYVKGNVAGIFCARGNHQREERKFRCGEKITMAVVVEPDSIYHERVTTNSTIKYSCIKMYLNGEEVACIGYESDSDSIVQRKPISFNGTSGDFYLYYILAYQSHYEWEQAFKNYLVKLTDTQAMMDEFDAEDVLDESGSPSLASIKAKGIPYYVVVAPQQVFDTFDGGTDTSEKFICTLYYFNPQKPWLDFKATNVQWRRQGTTSAKRPIKNDRFYLAKQIDKKNPLPMVVTLLHDRSEFTDPFQQAEYDKAAELASRNYVQVNGGIPVQIITVKVDYSDSSNANDCGICDLMNATFRAAGSRFLTPAQRNYDGTFTKSGYTISGLKMDHSTKNHPIAVFRATNEGMTDAWFHAKGNWKEDKGEQLALGFQKTPGYNLGCLNYGDFYEFFGRSGETLAQIETRFKSEWNTDQASANPQMKSDKPYLLSQYCGRDYRIMRFSNGAWSASTGSMTQNAQGKWVVTGDVLNPVTGFELLTYNDFCWWRGVSSVEDMMRMQSGKSSWVNKLVNNGDVSADTFPAWTQYFECMIDDDQLQIDLALGKKCPYDLYAMLKFCNDCDFRNVAENTWKTKWRNELSRYVSVRSLYAYTAFTDYLAATDQRAKNMQPMFFLEDGFSVTNGVYSSPFAVKMYLNKVYDCDTCNGKDNDGGCTVDAECDPNKPTVEGGYTNPYAGWDSILFNNVDKCPVVLDDDGTSEISLTDVVKTLRSASTTNDEGVQYVPFSPEGAMYHFVTKRLLFWPKLISSFDGERKYVESVGRADAVYFYALQGLGRTALPQFIEQRWNYRDGYYQTGGFVGSDHSISGRIGASNNNAGITIKAAKTGYFGVGYEKEGNVSEVVFLEAGQSHRFTQFDHNPGSLFWLYQADRVSELDISEISLDDNFSFAKMSLVEVLKVGSATKVDVPIATYTSLTTMNLGNLPFLRELDVRRTTVRNINASQCPRIESILAQGSQVSTCTLAETSPIETLALPASVTELQFVNLPNLSYPGGLSFEGLSRVQRLFISGSTKIDGQQILMDCFDGGATLQYIRLAGLNANGNDVILNQLMTSGVTGIDQNGNAYDEVNRCSGLIGRWILGELVDDSVVNSLNAYFPELEVYNSQFSVVCYDDTEDYCENITNLDNNTGYQFNNDYVASGHFKRLEEMSHGVRGLYNTATHEMEVEALDDENYNFLADGTSIDLADTSGLGYDFFKHVPSHWYKGINDFKNQRKYSLRSISQNEPISTATRITRAQVGTLLKQANSALVLSENIVGKEPSITLNASNNVYAIDVDGMKQVRWPGINSDVLCCVFLGADGKIISTFKMGISNAQFDFMVGEDYIFCDVPVGAVRFMFTTQIGCDAQEAIAVDSSALEAIEPDWVFRKEFLVGIYGMGQDGLSRARSISNTKAVVGTGSSTTSGAWTYDADGVVTNLSVPTSLNRTRQDCINLCEMRGEGFHAISYEQSKDLANIIMELVGTRNIQAYCGNGQGAGYTTGTQTINGKNINAHGNITLRNGSSGVGNLMFGIQNFVACNYEWMAHIAANVISFKDWKAKRCPTNDGTCPIDAKYHIYDVQTDTERVVQGINANGYCIGRVRHGRFMDTLASKVTSDNSQWNRNYSDGYYYSHDRCRVVGRASSNAGAYGGLVYSSAVNVSSFSHAVDGSRLAFSGKIVWRQPS